MVRTQIQLTEEQAAALRRLSISQKLSMAELIRQGVDLLINSMGGVDKKELIAQAIEAAGRFHSGVTDLSERHDDYFAEDI